MGEGLHVAGLVRLGLAASFLVSAPFVPWATYDADEGFGGPHFGVEGVAYLWSMDLGYTVLGSAGAERQGWYEDIEGDDPDGLASIRAGIPFILAGTALAAAGFLLLAVRLPRAAVIVALLGTVLCLVGLVLFAAGLSDLFRDVDVRWEIGLYLEVVALAGLLMGGVLALASREAPPPASAAGLGPGAESRGRPERSNPGGRVATP